MQSLIDLLKHPYTIPNKVASEIYQSALPADFVRLRSRITETHHFTEAEVSALQSYFSQKARAIKKTVGQLPRHLSTGENLLAPLQQLGLNLKAIVLSVPDTGLSYTQAYDVLRGRSKNVPAEFHSKLSNSLTEFAAFIEQQVATSKKEAKKYLFNYGKGGISHYGN